MINDNDLDYELIAATFTPFKQNLELNTSIINGLVEKLIKDGVKGFFVAGTTGEGLSLTVEERMKLAEKFMESVDDKAKVIIHVGALSLEDSKKLAKHARDIRAHGISLLLPFYYKNVEIEQYIEFLNQVAKVAEGLPMYLYHIPSLTGISLDLDQFLDRAINGIATFAGVKYSSPNLMELMLMKQKYDWLKFYFGVDEMMMYALPIRVDGFIGSTYNFAPRLYMQIIEAFREGNIDKATELQRLSLKTVQVLSRFGGLPALKAVMKLIGFDLGPCRPPLKSFDYARLPELERSLKEIGVLDLLG
ncbi:MAG: dihydrodipicolinate synthase family protein [Thermotoga caldifontis]|uniref:dihydrodipicolinate synthase family protein n=1 Tax=Thermotoga caldifontis TaxID=1508419 RepID=UPI003C7CAA46